MKLTSLLFQASLLVPGPAFALVGFDQIPYDPICAYACDRAIELNLLSCSNPRATNVDTMDMSMSSDMMDNSRTSPECFAGDTAYLTTLAWCVSSKCIPHHVLASKLELFRENQATGDLAVPPKWTYAQALQHVAQPPTRVLGNDDVLNFTALVNGSMWSLQASTLQSFYREEALHAKFGVIILVAGFAIPIVLTWVGYLPYMTGILEKTKPYVVYAPIIGTYHVRPLPIFLGTVPTFGQSLYITLFIILNIVLTAVGYEAVVPHAWFADAYQEIMAYVMWRTGTLGFAILPVVILFSGRNNILLWLSNWSHSTFLLLHRCIARLFGTYVILHSILALVLYVKQGSFTSDEKMSRWIWGVVATFTTVIMLVTSGLYVRRWSYEFFLIIHILMTIVTIAGCYYHVVLNFGYSWGHPQWIYAACAVWLFDRLMRMVHILKSGICRAQVTELSDTYVQIDVKGIRWDAEAGKHVYAYFPTLNPLRFWENHPFSPLPTSMLRSSHHSLSIHDMDREEGSDRGNVRKHLLSTTQPKAPVGIYSTAGITFFIKKSNGTTKFLKANENLLALLDGPYPNNSTKSTLRCDRLLLIGGGVGISALLSWLNVHPNAKLCWSMKKTAACLIQALDVVLKDAAEKDVKVGQRLGIDGLLSQEIDCGWAKVGVVVCGPGGLCDDVRAAVVAAGKKKNGPTIFELVVDSYCW